MKRLSLGLALAVSLSAHPVYAETLPGSEWAPVELAGEAIVPLGDIFVRFEQDNRFFGNDGCNSIRGSFVTNGDAILFGPAAATMMACPGQIMEQGNAFTAALMAARLFSRDGVNLTLSDANGDVLIKLTQRDAD